MYIAAAETAYEVGSKEVVKEILKLGAVDVLNFAEGGSKKNLVIILRCLIQLSYTSMVEENSELLLHYQYLQKSYKLLSTFDEVPELELEWIFRIAWNCK